MITRVMVLIDTLALGGAEHVAVDLACGLDPSRFAPHVLVTRSTGPLQRRLDDAGIPVTVLGRRRRISVAAYRQSRRIAAQCDLIHAHKYAGSAWGALLARATGKPLIAHEHNWSDTPSTSRSMITRHWIAPVASRYLCVSETVADDIRNDGVPADKIRVLHNAISTTPVLPRADARRELGLAPSAFVVGMVARLRPEKKHELLLDAAARVPAAQTDMTLCIVGDGPRRAFLEHLAHRLGIADRIVWAGERSQAGRLASAFDIAVLCSAWEGLPLAALEAMVAGTPLIATAVGGLPALLGDGAGILVPPNDVEALAAAITQLRSAPDAACRIGAAGHRKVRRICDPASIFASLERIYTDSIAAGAMT